MLKIGDVAPNFILPNQSGETIELLSLKGKNVVVYFYPKDMTPGCTKEACDLRDQYDLLQDSETEVLGISRDSIDRHQKFSTLFSLPFSLLADEDGRVCEQYGAWVQKSMFGKKYMGVQRMTYLIDKEGKIAWIWPKVSVVGHAQDVLDQIKNL